MTSNYFYFFLNCLLVACLSILLVSNAIAHEAGVTDTNIIVSNDSIDLVYTVPVDHVAEIIGDDAKANSIKHAIEAVQKGFDVTSNDDLCKMTSAGTRNLSKVKSRQFAYRYNCGNSIQSLNISYNLLFDTDRAHKNFARITFSGVSKNFTFTQIKRTVGIDIAAMTLEQFGGTQSNQSLINKITIGSNYFPVGVEHILLGPDHLLFLAALLLLPLRLKHILLLITTFTVSHSITLALSVMDIVVLQPGVVELVIALSIVYMAVETVYLLRQQTSTQVSKYLSGSVVYKRIAVTALFGLIHGFGFSYFLKEIGLGDQILSSLLFFNLGVEAGQLLAMIVFLPIVAFLFKRLATTVWAQMLALLIGVVGLLWLVERSHALFV